MQNEFISTCGNYKLVFELAGFDEMVDGKLRDFYGQNVAMRVFKLNPRARKESKKWENQRAWGLDYSETSHWANKITLRQHFSLDAGHYAPGAEFDWDAVEAVVEPARRAHIN